MVQVTYQKNNGTVFKRYRYTTPSYKIGDITSMGWKVLNIEYEYNNKFYPEFEYYSIMHNNKQKYIKRKQTRELYISEFKKIMYYFIAVVVLNFLKFILGV